MMTALLTATAIEGYTRTLDRKSTRLNSSHLGHLVCRLLLEKKNFMVRSYYPSECHADYFDFERIEALQPAIAACGVSTLYQSAMLGVIKQMANRTHLLLVS